MKPETTPNASKYALWIIVILMAVTLFGCFPTTTAVTPAETLQSTGTLVPVVCDPIIVNSGSGMTVLRFPDGWKIHLAENTEIEFIPGGYCPGIREIRVVLRYGQIAVRSLLSDKGKITVTNPQGYSATLDVTGLVSYDQVTDTFQLACTNGTCVLGADPQQVNQLVCGESGLLDKSGTFSGPFPVDLSILILFGDWLLPTCELVGTPIPVTETPDAAATATAYCATFESEFPLTPCPSAQP